MIEGKIEINGKPYFYREHWAGDDLAGLPASLDKNIEERISKGTVIQVIRYVAQGSGRGGRSTKYKVIYTQNGKDYYQYMSGHTVERQGFYL